MQNDLTHTTKLLDALSDIVENARSAAFSTKNAVIDRTEFQELLKELHLSLPRSMQLAESLLEDREKIETDAFKRADEIMDKAKLEANEMLIIAREKADNLISENVITNEGRRNAQAIVHGAIQISNDLKEGVDNYFNTVIDKLEADVIATENKIATLSEELEKHRQYLAMNRERLAKFTEEYDRNIDLATNRLKEVIVQQLNHLIDSDSLSKK